MNFRFSCVWGPNTTEIRLSLLEHEHYALCHRQQNPAPRYEKKWAPRYDRQAPRYERQAPRGAHGDGRRGRSSTEAGCILIVACPPHVIQNIHRNHRLVHEIDYIPKVTKDCFQQIFFRVPERGFHVPWTGLGGEFLFLKFFSFLSFVGELVKSASIFSTWLHLKNP